MYVRTNGGGMSGYRGMGQTPAAGMISSSSSPLTNPQNFQTENALLMAAVFGIPMAAFYFGGPVIGTVVTIGELALAGMVGGIH